MIPDDTPMIHDCIYGPQVPTLETARAIRHLICICDYWYAADGHAYVPVEVLPYAEQFVN